MLWTGMVPALPLHRTEEHSEQDGVAMMMLHKYISQID